MWTPISILTPRRSATLGAALWVSYGCGPPRRVTPSCWPGSEHAADTGRVLWAVEGTRHYGLGLSRFLSSQGEVVTEIDSSRHIGKRRAGKSDPIDALRAARNCWPAPSPPRCRADGDREALRLLMIDRDNAVDSMRSARTVLTSLIVTAPAETREQLRHLSRDRRARVCSQLVCPPGADRLTQVLHQTLASVASRSWPCPSWWPNWKPRSPRSSRTWPPV